VVLGGAYEEWLFPPVFIQDRKLDDFVISPSFKLLSHRALPVMAAAKPVNKH